MKTERLLEKLRKVSEVVVLTRAGPEPRHQTRDKADRAAGFSRAEGGVVAVHTPQAGKQRPRGKKEQPLRYLKEVKPVCGKCVRSGVRRPGFRSQFSYLLLDEWW